ncbi:MAG: hypothetical protein MJA84_07125 [Firmicutes bacterium]|nr:hypothetical protein [Bacillota bacterium]
MDYKDCYDDLQAIIKALGIKITDDTKPDELFDATIKVLAAYISRLPSDEEITDSLKRQIARDVRSHSFSRG